MEGDNKLDYKNVCVTTTMDIRRGAVLSQFYT